VQHVRNFAYTMQRMGRTIRFKGNVYVLHSMKTVHIIQKRQ